MQGNRPTSPDARPQPERAAPRRSAGAVPQRLQALVTLAALVERMDRSAERPDAAQYRSVVQRLAEELDRHEPDGPLHEILRASPATALVYENLRYARAGLCLAPLEQSLNSELAATAALQKAARSAREATGPSGAASDPSSGSGPV